MKNKTIYGYELKYLLGEGGMAEVWYAENSIGNQVAVKVLKEEFTKMKQVIDRFENEAKVMVKLNHPNIRKVSDYGTIDDRPCIVMEYMEGKDLSVRMNEGECFETNQLKPWWNLLVGTLAYTKDSLTLYWYGKAAKQGDATGQKRLTQAIRRRKVVWNDYCNKDSSTI